MYVGCTQDVRAPSGSIARAAQVLDMLADRPEGAALTEIAGRTALTKSSAHRVLAALQSVDFVTQDPSTRAYRLALRLGELSRRARMIDVEAIAGPGMARLAEATDDTVFLSIPEGPAAVCVARRVGAYPIRTLTLDRGDRRPLGVGAGALALYGAMPEETRHRVCEINASWLSDYGFDHAALEALRAESRRRGYAWNPGSVVTAMSAAGLPLVTRSGRLVGALAVGAINERMQAARLDTVVLPALRAEAARLAKQLSDWEDGGIQ
jgi:DNA-binding IclR family transcriptional regulator